MFCVEGGAQVFGVAAGLLLGLVGVEVRPFGFQDAERSAFSGAGARYIVPLQNKGKDGEMATPVLLASCADF